MYCGLIVYVDTCRLQSAELFVSFSPSYKHCYFDQFGLAFCLQKDVFLRLWYFRILCCLEMKF